MFHHSPPPNFPYPLTHCSFAFKAQLRCHPYCDPYSPDLDSVHMLSVAYATLDDGLMACLLSSQLASPETFSTARVLSL